MVGSAKLMHCFNQRQHVIRVDLRMNAVAKVEHMSWAGAIGGENARHLRANGCRRSIEGGWIEVALQGDPISYLCAGISQLDCPVQAQAVEADISHTIQP